MDNNNKKDGQIARCQMRAMTHLAQIREYENLIEKLKPEWYEEDEKGLRQADEPDNPAWIIHDMFRQVDKVWDSGENWNDGLDKAVEKARKELA